jgi:glucose-1-phosphate thymidylyltransferase
MTEALGVVPAAGVASRLWPYRAPKELVQVGYRTVPGDPPERLLPMAAIEHMLHRLRSGGVTDAALVLSAEKFDVFRYLGSGRHIGMNLAYLCQETPLGMPHAIDLAWPLLAGRTVCMGMPDTIVKPDDCFAQLLDFHFRAGADLSLGVFPTDDARASAPVLLDRTGGVLAIVDKPEAPPAQNTWGIAVWSPAFSALLHDFVEAAERRGIGTELVLSDVFVSAMTAGLTVRGLLFESGAYHDIGTPAGIVRTRELLESDRRQPTGRYPCA